MKKIILIGIVIVVTIACKKKLENCWRCYGSVPATGASNLVKDTCTPDGNRPVKIDDGFGNDWNFTCEHR